MSFLAGRSVQTGLYLTEAMIFRTSRVLWLWMNANSINFWADIFCNTLIIKNRCAYICADGLLKIDYW